MTAPRTAILCPGPSLARLDADRLRAFDLVLAVNRAAVVAPCHWWVFFDAEGLVHHLAEAEDAWGHRRVPRERTPAWPPRLFTKPDQLDRFTGAGSWGPGAPLSATAPLAVQDVARAFVLDRLAARAVLHAGDVSFPSAQQPEHWGRFTTCAAVIFAAFLGARSVRVFGHDMAGDCDFRGATSERRVADRWNEERHMWSLLAAWAARIGVGLVRERADGLEEA